MFQEFVLILLLVSGTNQSNASKSTDNPFGYELLQHRMDDLHQSHYSSSDQMTKILTKNFKHIKRLLNGILNNTNYSAQMLSLHLKHQRPIVDCCQGVDTSGKYIFQASSKSAPFPVLCEAEYLDDGGWLVIQQRRDGFVRFNRSWVEYRDGFGIVGRSNEFWLGLEKLYQFTDNAKFELVIEVKSGYARYSQFQVAGKDESYKLIRLGNYSGTIGDNMSSSLNKKFSTYDNDNDDWGKGNCASSFGGGWWYSGCGNINLNGPFEKVGGTNAWTSLVKAASYSRMMIRRKIIKLDSTNTEL